MNILLDCGHCLQGADTGAQGNGRKEQDCTREIGYKVKSKLESLGHTVVICFCDSASNVMESLTYRVNTANANGGDLYISIHLNAGGGYGTEVYTYGAKYFTEADGVLNELVALGFTNRGIKDGSGLYVIKNTNMKAMLVECAFLDSKSDMDKYSAENFANAIVKGITGQTVKPIPVIAKVTPKVVTTIKPVSQGNAWVKRLQQECNNQGLSNQIVDGWAGTNTLKGCPNVGQGAKGNITYLLQEKLVSFGYSTNGVDANFGNGTYMAVCCYQRDCGLSSDGIVGQNTWKKLLGL